MYRQESINKCKDQNVYGQVFIYLQASMYRQIYWQESLGK